MEEYRMHEHSMHRCERHWMWKYLGILLATLVGSFLAFYFAVNCTMQHFIHKTHTMREMHRMEKMAMQMEHANKDYKIINKDFFKSKNAIDFIKMPDAYKFIVDLTPFQGNPNAVKVDINDKQITISGESEINRNNTETFTKISQTYTFGKEAKLDKISKKKFQNKYLITVPIED